MAFKIYIPSKEITIDKEFKTTEGAHAYATSIQLQRDDPALFEQIKSCKYDVIED